MFPGHDYKGRRSSSIGVEKAMNPRLQARSREAYVEMMSNLNLPPPRMIERALPANLKLGLVEEVAAGAAAAERRGNT